MLHLLDETLEVFLRSVVPLPAREVDVAFEAPDGDWSTGISRPTVDLYLWDVRLSPGARESGFEVDPAADPSARRRGPLPRIDCRYLVTAWTSEVRDEHSLLGDVLTALLRHPVIEESHLSGAYADIRPLPTVALRSGDGTESAELWSALGGQLRPGLDVVVSATVDAALTRPVGPPVTEYVLRPRSRSGEGDEEVVMGTAGTASA